MDAPIELTAVSVVQSRDAFRLTSVATEDWFWEGNVADAVATFLVAEGWIIKSQADTRTKARGLDIHAICGECELMIEAKG